MLQKKWLEFVKKCHRTQKKTPSNKLSNENCTLILTSASADRGKQNQQREKKTPTIAVGVKNKEASMLFLPM